MSSRHKLQLWAIARDADVLGVLVLCVEHAQMARDPDFVLPPPATHAFRVRHPAFVRALRGATGCAECALRTGKRMSLGDLCQIGELKAATLAAGGDA